MQKDHQLLLLTVQSTRYGIQEIRHDSGTLISGHWVGSLSKNTDSHCLDSGPGLGKTE
jgi:hypothetical protein